MTLDVLRGIALFGVLWINVLTGFRLSLFEHILTFHTHPGWLNEGIDLFTAWLVEFKAFSVFSFLFGVGICVQTGRLGPWGINLTHFMLRRFAFLLLMGLIHMFLIWNGDILCLYAICGILVIPLLRLPTSILIMAGIAAILFGFFVGLDASIPPPEAMRAHAAAATPIYAHGTFLQILVLREQETWGFIVPLLVNSFPKTIGLILLGMAAGRSGILQQPAGHRTFLVSAFAALTLVGAVCTSLIFWSAITGGPLRWPSAVTEAFASIPLALGMTSGVALWLSYCGNNRWVRLWAAAGQMSLTNYLLQSLVFSFIFYGFGLGLFGKLSPAATSVIAILVFMAQLLLSRVWLQSYRFGPAEWLWRSATYGAFQSMQRFP